MRLNRGKLSSIRYRPSAKGNLAKIKKGGEIIRKVNMILRSQMALWGITIKELSKEMGINRRVFSNKLGRRVVNGYVIQFTEAQKEWLADKFGIEITDIE